jgi:hypothetical protein
MSHPVQKIEREKVLSTLRDCIAERDLLLKVKESTDTAPQEVVEESRDDGNQVTISNDDERENNRVTNINSSITSKKQARIINNNKTTNKVVVDKCESTSEGMFTQILAHLHDKRASTNSNASSVGKTNSNASSVGKTNKVVVVKSLLSSKEGLATIHEQVSDVPSSTSTERSDSPDCAYSSSSDGTKLSSNTSKMPNNSLQLLIRKVTSQGPSTFPHVSDAKQSTSSSPSENAVLNLNVDNYGEQSGVIDRKEDGDLNQGQKNENDGIIKVEEASCWSAFTSFFFYSDIDCDSVVNIDDNPQSTQAILHPAIPFASSTSSILRSRSCPETPRERAWLMDNAVAPGNERQEATNKHILPEGKAAKTVKEGLLPRFLKIVCTDEMLVEHITLLDVNSKDIKVTNNNNIRGDDKVLEMKERALEEAIKANEEATARIVALLQHYSETKTEFDRNVNRKENKLKKEAADAEARVAEMEQEIRAKSEALTKEMDQNLALQDQIIRLTESIAKSWDEELMNYQSRLDMEKKILSLEYDVEAGRKATLEMALKEICSELGYIEDNHSQAARRVEVLRELLEKTTTKLSSFDSALHDERAVVDEQLQTQIRSLQSQQQSFEELLSAASITEQECALQMKEYLSIVESIEESLKQSSSNNESQEHDDMVVINEELEHNTNEVVVVKVDSNEVIDLEHCESIEMSRSDEHPTVTVSESLSDVDAQELVSISTNEEVAPIINDVEEVESNELIDLLQNESIEMICCPEVPDTPSAMETDPKTMSSKDDDSVHSSTKFLLIAMKSEDLEGNATSPCPQSLVEKESFHNGPSLPDSLDEYYARESVSPCSIVDVIVVDGPSPPNCLDEYYTRSSGSQCSIDDANSFSYKAFLGGMLSKSRSMSSSASIQSTNSKQVAMKLSKSQSMSSTGSKLSTKSELFAKKFLFPSISLSSSQTSKSKISQILSRPRSSSTFEGSEISKETRQVIDPSWTVADNRSKPGALASSYPASYEEYVLSESVSSVSDMEVGSTSSGSFTSLTKFVEERPTPKSILFRREHSSNSSFQDQALLSTSEDDSVSKMYTTSVEKSGTSYDSTLDTTSVENSYTTSVESQQETTTSSSASEWDTESSSTKIKKLQQLPPLHPRTNLAGIRAGKLGVLVQ